jgi:hypothetical protein
VGGNTREGGKNFYVREEFADEGKQHANSILTGLRSRIWGYESKRLRINLLNHTTARAKAASERRDHF